MFRLVAVIILFILTGCASIEINTLPATSDQAATTQSAELIEAERQEICRQQESLRYPKTPEEKEAYHRLETEVLARAKGMTVSNLSIEGEVVDEEGRPLDGVMVKVIAGTHKQTWLDYLFHPYRDRAPTRQEIEEAKKRMVVENKIINKTFSIKAQGGTSVSIYFEKAGYSHQWLRLSKEKTIDSIKECFKRSAIFPSPTIKGGIRVMLIKRPK